MDGGIDIITDLKSFRWPAKAQKQFFPKGRLFHGRYFIGRFFSPEFCCERFDYKDF